MDSLGSICRHVKGGTCARFMGESHLSYIGLKWNLRHRVVSVLLLVHAGTATQSYIMTEGIVVHGLTLTLLITEASYFTIV